MTHKEVFVLSDGTHIPEIGVGKAIKLSGVDRKEMFITSKIPAHIKTYQEAKLQQYLLRNIIYF